MSELKCCRLCGAFLTCTHKGECCPECHYFDPEEGICLAPETEKHPKKVRIKAEEPKEVDPETFLFEDDEEDITETELEMEPDDIEEELFASSEDEYDEW